MNYLKFISLILVIYQTGFAQNKSEYILFTDILTLINLPELKEIYVSDSYIPTALKEKGLNNNTIRTDIELKLRLAGIRVIDESGFKKEPGTPMLQCNINLLGSADRYFYKVEISIWENLKSVFRKSKGEYLLASTWNYDTLAITDNINDIRNSIRDITEYFINEYLKANTK